MRTIKANDIKAAAVKLAHDCCVSLAPDALRALKDAAAKENSERAKFALDVLIDNAKVAKCGNVPLCQDTGMAVFFVEIGQDVHIEGDLNAALDEAVGEAYGDGLRPSVLDPLSRKNTGDNRPPIIHYDIVKGDRLKISFLPKGFGAENMSKLYMLFPSAGREGVIKSVVDAAKYAGACPCPPYVVGVGLGGTAEKAMEMAKHSLLREIGTPNPDAELDKLEKDIKAAIDALNIGASGFGGKITALDCHVEKYPTHIAGLPVAVNFGCNAMRRGTIEL